MSTIKKAYVELSEILEANKNKKVSTILPQLLELMTAKGGGSAEGKTFHKDENGETIAVFCYYHKKWELVSANPYGNKKGTASGLNTMCKVGVSNWTKQQRRAKQANEALLDMVSSGDLLPENIGTEQAKIQEAKKLIVDQAPELSFDSLEELLG